MAFLVIFSKTPPRIMECVFVKNKQTKKQANMCCLIGERQNTDVN